MSCSNGFGTCVAVANGGPITCQACGYVGEAGGPEIPCCPGTLSLHCSPVIVLSKLNQTCLGCFDPMRIAFSMIECDFWLDLTAVSATT